MDPLLRMYVLLERYQEGLNQIEEWKRELMALLHYINDHVRLNDPDLNIVDQTSVYLIRLLRASTNRPIGNIADTLHAIREDHRLCIALEVAIAILENILTRY